MKKKHPKTVREIFEMSKDMPDEQRITWIGDEASKLADKGDPEANELMCEIFSNLLHEAETNPDVPKEDLELLRTIMEIDDEDDDN